MAVSEVSAAVADLAAVDFRAVAARSAAAERRADGDASPQPGGSRQGQRGDRGGSVRREIVAVATNSAIPTTIRAALAVLVLIATLAMLPRFRRCCKLVRPVLGGWGRSTLGQLLTLLLVLASPNSRRAAAAQIHAAAVALPWPTKPRRAGGARYHLPAGAERRTIVYWVLIIFDGEHGRDRRRRGDHEVTTPETCARR